MSRIAAVLLAAGGSSRYGSPKQLARLSGECLVLRACRAAVDSRADAVYVVLGAHAEAVGAELEDLDVRLVGNPAWEGGLAGSIRAGLAALEPAGDPLDGVLLLLADQPGVDATLLDALIDRFDGRPGGVVACEYEGEVGVPALFGRAHFSALSALEGDRGAQGILRAQGPGLERVAFPAGALDVDTPDDLARASEASGASRR